MIHHRRWSDEGVLVRETTDGIDLIENLGKTRQQLGISLPNRQRQKLSVVRRIANATGAATRIFQAKAAGQQVMVRQAEQERRLWICSICEFYTGKTCKKCGCHIRFKAKLQTEHCPIGKW